MIVHINQMNLISTMSGIICSCSNWGLTVKNQYVHIGHPLFRVHDWTDPEAKFKVIDSLIVFTCNIFEVILITILHYI